MPLQLNIVSLPSQPSARWAIFLRKIGADERSGPSRFAMHARCVNNEEADVITKCPRPYSSGRGSD
jgi:hypothetical protein